MHEVHAALAAYDEAEGIEVLRGSDGEDAVARVDGGLLRGRFDAVCGGALDARDHDPDFTPAWDFADRQAVEVRVFDNEVHSHERFGSLFPGCIEFGGFFRGVDAEDFCEREHGGDDAEDSRRVADRVGEGGQGGAVRFRGGGVALGNDGDRLLGGAEGRGVRGRACEKPHAGEGVHSRGGHKKDGRCHPECHHGGGEGVEAGAVVFEGSKEAGAELQADGEYKKDEAELAHEFEDFGLDADSEVPGGDAREKHGGDAGADAANFQAREGEPGHGHGGKDQHGPGDGLGFPHFQNPGWHAPGFRQRTAIAASGNKPHAESGVEGAGELHFTRRACSRPC